MQKYDYVSRAKVTEYSHLKKAEETLKEREEQYERRGTDKYAIFTRTAELWSALFGIKVSQEDVTRAMILFKMARDDKGKYHEDNYVDMIGYAELLGRMQNNHYAQEQD